MKLIDIIKKKIALRKQRKAIMSRIRLENDMIVIDADVVVNGKIGGR